MNTKSTILIVDDSPDMRTLLTALLTDQHVEVRSASSGEQALAAVAEKPPDLILLDIRMPGLDGFEVCRRLKAQASSRDIPIIFISAVTESAEKVGAFDLGAADFVSKPIQGDELRARVRTQLELRRLRVQSERQAEVRVEQMAERLTLAADAASIGVWDWDLKADQGHATPIYFTMLGYNPEEGVMNREQWLEHIHPEDRNAVAETIRAALGGGGVPYKYEARAQHADGSFRWVSVIGSVLARDEHGQASRLLGVRTDITERKQAEETLRTSLQEKEALLKEVHHRVKNNLQVITSLLRLEAGRNEDPSTKSVLKDMQGRIQSMALLHETLYRSAAFGEVDLGGYLRQVANQSFRALNAQPGSIRLDLDLVSVQVKFDQAIPCGLLVNELISNCLKHGFSSGHIGGISVELQPVGGGLLHLSVGDTGVGLPANFDSKRGQSLGLQLVSDLARQLGGRLEIGPGPGSGAVFAVTFPGGEPMESGNGGGRSGAMATIEIPRY